MELEKCKQILCEHKGTLIDNGVLSLAVFGSIWRTGKFHLPTLKKQLEHILSHDR